MSEDWRRVAAALSSVERREAWARAVLGLTQQGRRGAKHTADLQAAGLLDAEGNPTTIFADLLAVEPAPARHGIDRWVRNGRIEQFPSKRGDRRELLGWVAARVVGENEIIDEATVNERLSAVTDDYATLRRYLIDGGLLARDDFGRHYRKGAELQ